MEFDETKAIEFIKSRLPENAPNYDDDEILNIIDMIFDYYEDNGLLDINADDEDEDIDKIISYVNKMLAKDTYSTIKSEHVPLIVSAEIEYEESLI